MSPFRDDDDVLEGIPLSDDEEPTRTVERPAGGTGDALPGRPARPEGQRWPGHSVPSLVGSEEALRVFDELSNPDASAVTFSGLRRSDGRYGETLPPAPPPAPSGEGVTQELSFEELMEAEEGPTVAPPAGPGGMDVDLGTYHDAYLVFEHSPCPLFRLDAEGRIRLANLAFCRFLSLSREAVIGQPIHRTRLGQIYPDLREEVDEALTARAPLQQVLAFQDARGKTVRFLIWIVPFPREVGRTSSAAGIILPYPG